MRFPLSLERAVVENAKRHFAQAWNYRYASSCRSPEFSTRWPGTPGHDPLEIVSAHLLADGHTLFLEIPQLQPCVQLHLHVGLDAEIVDIFATPHKLGSAFSDFGGYQRVVSRPAEMSYFSPTSLSRRSPSRSISMHPPNAASILIYAPFPATGR